MHSVTMWLMTTIHKPKCDLQLLLWPLITFDHSWFVTVLTSCDFSDLCLLLLSHSPLWSLVTTLTVTSCDKTLGLMFSWLCPVPCLVTTLVTAVVTSVTSVHIAALTLDPGSMAAGEAVALMQGWVVTRTVWCSLITDYLDTVLDSVYACCLARES